MIVVAGESLVDLIAGEDGALRALPGGGPFNVARGLARLGAEVAFLGAVSGDRFGRVLRARLADDGVDLRALVATELPTMLALAELDADGAAGYRFYAQGTAAASLRPGQAAAALQELRVDALHVGSLGLALEPLAAAVEELVARAPDDAIVMADPNWRPGAVPEPRRWRTRLGRVLSRADVVKVSTEDLEHLRPAIAAIEAARGLVGGRTRCVLLTDGGAPVRVLCAEGEVIVVPPPADVVDTVGAGDAFGAGFLAWCTAHGMTRADLGVSGRVREAAAFATRVAARTCERAGADPPHLADLQPIGDVAAV